MKKLHDCARKASLDKDQEQEFIYLHRYFMILKLATNYPEFTKDSVKYNKDFSCALNNLNKYESLQTILSTR